MHRPMPNSLHKIPLRPSARGHPGRHPMVSPLTTLTLPALFSEEIGFTGHIGREQAQLNPGISSSLSYAYRDSHASPRAAGPAGALAPALGRVAPRGTTIMCDFSPPAPNYQLILPTTVETTYVHRRVQPRPALTITSHSKPFWI